MMATLSETPQVNPALTLPTSRCQFVSLSLSLYNGSL